VDEGHELARMIRPGGRRIAAVIGGNDQLVARPQKCLERGQPRIERLEGSSIAADVAAMAKLRIKVVEIREYESRDRPGSAIRSSSPLRRRCRRRAQLT